MLHLKIMSVIFTGCNYYNLCPVHPSHPNEEHRFRIYHANWSGPARVNAGIGRQVRNGG